MVERVRRECLLGCQAHVQRHALADASLSLSPGKRNHVRAAATRKPAYSMIIRSLERCVGPAPRSVASQGHASFSCRAWVSCLTHLLPSCLANAPSLSPIPKRRQTYLCEIYTWRL